MKMDPKVKALWIAALRDGSFEKGKYGLRDLDECFDATGVLCELAVSAGIIPEAKKWTKDTGANVFFGYTYSDPDSKSVLATGLPRAVTEWSGVAYRTGYRVAMMGDKGKTFDQIAEYIEENL